MASLEDELRSEVMRIRYQSRNEGVGVRGLCQHHIDAVVDALLPWLERKLSAEPKTSTRIGEH
ncbi:MAG TPA: hypothetical protein VE779_11460 [Candidatus Angelobacter sp.]|nr:hypothetical protein [Candidatus Angelobacter sp.]